MIIFFVVQTRTCRIFHYSRSFFIVVSFSSTNTFVGICLTLTSILDKSVEKLVILGIIL